MVLAGLRAAAALNLPLRIGGRDVTIPTEFCPDIDENDVAPSSIYDVTPDKHDGPRRIACCLAAAARAVEGLALEIGTIDQPTPLASEEPPGWFVHVPTADAVVAPEPHVVEIGDGACWVGWADLVCEVRRQRSLWMVVGLPSTLMGVHPTRDAAVAWATAFSADHWHSGIANAPPNPKGLAHATPEESR